MYTFGFTDIVECAGENSCYRVLLQNFIETKYDYLEASFGARDNKC